MDRPDGGRGQPVRRWRAGAALLAALLVVPLAVLSCTAEDDDEGRGLRGAQLEVLATWAGAEQAGVEEVLAGFTRRTGVAVRYTTARHRMPEALAARLGAGRPPDVAFLPQPGLLREHAAAGHLVPLDATTTALVEARLPSALRALASYDGRLHGVWFKAADKSLVWYDVAAFERLGAVPPRDLEGLLALARRFAAAGVPAFGVAGGDGWTLTDWFEVLYLRLAGPRAYDELAERRRPWTDPSVVRTLRVLADLWSPGQVAGGAAGALRTGFEDAVRQAFGPAPGPAMLVGGDFVAGFLTGGPGARLQVDADVFAFPAGPFGATGVVAGGDVAVLMRDTPAGAALLRYLAEPESAQVWARRGGFLSPNADLDLAAYGDDVARSVARRVLEAGDDLRFDLSDLQPAALGGEEDRGLRAELRRFLAERDPVATATRLEAAARAAWEEPS